VSPVLVNCLFLETVYSASIQSITPSENLFRGKRLGTKLGMISAFELSHALWGLRTLKFIGLDHFLIYQIEYRLTNWLFFFFKDLWLVVRHCDVRVRKRTSNEFLS